MKQRKLLYNFSILLIIINGPLFLFSQSSNSVYGECSVIETNILNSQNSSFTPGVSLGIGFRNDISNSKYFYDLNAQIEYLRFHTKRSFIEPFGTIVDKVQIANLVISGNLGYRISDISLQMGIGTYFNIDSSFKSFQEDNYILLTESDILISPNNRLKRIGLNTSMGISYKISEKVDIDFSTEISFVDGLNPINSNGLRYTSLIKFGLGIRRYFKV